jgi:hypothetical protein
MSILQRAINALKGGSRVGIASYPTIIGFDGNHDWQSISDSLRPFTDYTTIEEYITKVRKKKSLLDELKDKLHERHRCNYFYSGKNTNVDVGLNMIAQHMTNRATGGWTHMNVGTGAGTTTSNMTDLVAALTPRLPLSGAFDAYNVAYHTCYYSINDPDSSSHVLTEVAPFTALTSGTMLGRFVIPSYTKDNTKSFNAIYATTLTAV